MAYKDWLGLKRELPHNRQLLLAFLSFFIPIALWCFVSYVPWVWHPLIHITNVGEVDYFSEGLDIPKGDFYKEVAKAKAGRQLLPQGYLVNPVYLPACSARKNRGLNAVISDFVRQQEVQ